MTEDYALSVTASADPYPYYKELRDHDPVHYSASEDIWVLTRYDDCHAAFSDWATWSSERRGNLLNDIPERVGKTLGTTDPPRHTVARRLVSTAFTPYRVSQLEPEMRALARRLAEEAVATSNDFVQHVSVPYNAAILGSMFGLAEREFVDLRRFLDDFFVRDKPSRGGETRQTRAMAALRTYLTALTSERRRHPGPDLLSAMIAAEDAGARLSEEQVVVTTMTFLTAGFESVNNFFTNAVRALGLHGDARRAVTADPSLVPGVLEEVMRWDAPAQGFVRSPARDVEVRQRLIPEGAQVMLHVGAANRDERQFPEPDAFDVARGDRHLALGHGTHFCIGAALARQMSRVLFEELLARATRWEVDEDNGVRVTTPNFRGFSSLPVSL